MGLAAAAAVLFAFGSVTYFTADHTDAFAADIDQNLANAIIKTHDRCAYLPHSMPGVPVHDIAGTGQSLNRKLHQPVLAASLPEKGWKFKGGAVCPVGSVESAHLVFEQGSAAVSIFSMPRSSCSAKHNGSYEKVVADHPIAGFMDGQGSYCLVASGDGSITPARLAAMRDKIQSNIVRTPVAARETIANAELLQPYR